VGLKDRWVHWDADRMGRGMRIAQITAQIMLIICYQIELDKLNINETLTYNFPKMCWFMWMRFCTISYLCLSLSSTAAVSAVLEL
jgi:hypothetical protein